MSEKLPIGAYDPDASNEIAYYYVDEHNMFVSYSENKGVGDSIGRSFEGYYIYHDPNLIDGIDSCWNYLPEFNNKMVGIRHPEMHLSTGEFSEGFWERRMSRDHYINTIVALKLWEYRNYYKLEKLNQIIKATPFKIRRMARWTLTLILWAKAVGGNNFALWWYLILEIITVNAIYVPLHKLGYKIAGWNRDEVDQDEWGWYSNMDWTKESDEWKKEHLLQQQRKLNTKISKSIYPAYALGLAWKQQYVLPKHKFPKLQKKLKNSYLKMVAKTNYVQRMMFGDKNIPREKIEAFKPMYGSRWSGHLCGRNDRHMAIMPEGRYVVNQMDVDFVRTIYNETQLG